MCQPQGVHSNPLLPKWPQSTVPGPDPHQAPNCSVWPTEPFLGSLLSPGPPRVGDWRAPSGPALCLDDSGQGTLLHGKGQKLQGHTALHPKPQVLSVPPSARRRAVHCLSAPSGPTARTRAALVSTLCPGLEELSNLPGSLSKWQGTEPDCILTCPSWTLSHRMAPTEIMVIDAMWVKGTWSSQLTASFQSPESRPTSIVLPQAELLDQAGN